MTTLPNATVLFSHPLRSFHSWCSVFGLGWSEAESPSLCASAGEGSHESVALVPSPTCPTILEVVSHRRRTATPDASTHQRCSGSFRPVEPSRRLFCVVVHHRRDACEILLNDVLTFFPHWDLGGAGRLHHDPHGHLLDGWNSVSLFNHCDCLNILLIKHSSND